MPKGPELNMLSILDAGKKCFGINLIQDSRIIKDILERLQLEAEG